jgi:hypothetical protein
VQERFVKRQQALINRRGTAAYFPRLRAACTQPQAIRPAFVIGICLNLGFVVVEGFYGWQVNSLALLADARHNLSDVGWLILAWLQWQLPGYYRMIGMPTAGGAARSSPALSMP